MELWILINVMTLYMMSELWIIKQSLYAVVVIMIFNFKFIFILISFDRIYILRHLSDKRVMELLKSAGHPEEIAALLSFKFGKCSTVKPKCSMVSIPQWM